MLHPEILLAEIVADLTTDTFAFNVNKKPDQNFDADEMTFPAIFLDLPIQSKVTNELSNVQTHQLTISLFIAYKVEIDDTQSAKHTTAKVNAWEAAKEIVLRLRNYGDATPGAIVELSGQHEIVDVDNVFDINLCGCLLTFQLKIKDVTTTCIN